MAEPFRCPGCGKDVTDFMAHDAHFTDDVDLRTGNSAIRPPWPWTDSKNADQTPGTVCSWTRDYLSAEWLRQHPQPWSYT